MFKDLMDNGCLAGALITSVCITCTLEALAIPSYLTLLQSICLLLLACKECADKLEQ